jgi:dCTP deaminase
MVIAGKKFLKAIKKKNIVITPYNPDNLGPNSYDVHLGKTLAKYRDPVLDVRKRHEVDYFDIPASGLTLIPGEFYLGCTIEHIATNKYLPWLDGNSSLARLGLLIHYTAGRGDRGFSGHFTTEMSAQLPIVIYPGMLIGQITFLKTTKPLVSYNKRGKSKYNNTSNLPQPSKMYENFINDVKYYESSDADDIENIGVPKYLRSV